LAIGAGYAKNQNASSAKCSKATLHGKYVFAYDGFVIQGNEKVPFASSGYEVYDGNGHVKGVSTNNLNGKVTRNRHYSGVYTVKADCTGTSFGQFDLFIAPDGSRITFVETKPSEFVVSGVEQRATAKRVGP